MPTPTTYAPAKQFVGIATEAVQGTAVAMTSTVLVDQMKPKDNPQFLDDKSWRGSMATDSFAKIAGVKTAEVELGGPAYGDGLGYFLRNILGDLTYTGTSTGTGSTTLAAAASAGATSISCVGTIPNGTIVQIGTGATAEVFTTGTPTGSGPYTIPLTTPTSGLVYAHASAQAVQPVTGPYTQAHALLNSGSGQPVTHTITHFLGPTATSGARQYPGACFSELSMKWNAESELLTWSGKATTWPSVALGSAPVAAPSTVLPVASWRMLLGIGGPATGATLINTVTDGELTIKREVNPYFTVTGTQNPYIIQRGGLSVEGKLNFVAADESPLLYMLNNTQPQLQIVLDNGLTSTNKITFQIDCQTAAFTSMDPEGTKSAVEYGGSFTAILNTTNSGGSGGYSPIKVSVTNNVPPGTY
ncbi:phage tail tube protein [Streptomyces sp. NPDC020801]|uniref:phage tail tube protein n=1 Tax=Streptomyces sp. NPDC020801 TaxID=3365093 RepID=UPI00378F13D1